MSLIWWILPSISGVLGLILLFAGFAKMAGMKPFAGVARLAFGSGFLGLAGVIAFAGLNLQTYHRLTFERPVATVKFSAVPNQTDTYQAIVEFRQMGTDPVVWTEEDGRMPVFIGKQWIMGARVLKIKPMANILGYDSLYRLEFMASMDISKFSSGKVSKADFFAKKFIEEEPGWDIGKWAKENGGKLGVVLAEDANYGSATYNMMGDGFEYEVMMTQTGLIARATPETTKKIEQLAYPGYVNSLREIQ
ncbi:hypothetical protein [Hyphomonas sp.]|uniref:hypothetical protein n=1 Tax=Hyphomonas sp. TaxID=87 RepID=UPI0025C2EB58|nr:hypothetical protein [Hyphomonas sp.]MBI1401295.1 hypothetical protein [Hyphomonas sp.]